MNFIMVSLFAMGILALWGSVSVFGGLMLTRAKEIERKSFGQMNAAWGVVNIILAAATIATLWPRIGMVADVSYQMSQIRVIGINVLLDMGYISVGYMLAKRTQATPRQKGFGKAVMLQGAFLLVFDSILYLLLTAAR